MKNRPIHYKRFYTDQEAYCGVKLDDGPGSITKLDNTIFRNQATCKNCRRRIQKHLSTNQKGL